MPNTIDKTQLAYLEGFVKQCADLGIDPEQALESTKGIDKLDSRVAGGLRGAAAGAAVGGATGVAIPLVAAALFMIKNPGLRKMISVKDMARVMASGGLLGVGSGAAAGSMLGAIGADATDAEPAKSRTQAALRGAGHGALIGTGLGTAVGASLPLLQLLALKLHGGNARDIGAGNILKAMGRNALTGGIGGGISGTGIGASLGAALGKQGSAIERIWSKVGLITSVTGPGSKPIGPSVMPGPGNRGMLPPPNLMPGPGNRGMLPPPKPMPAPGGKTNPIGGGLGAGTATYKTSDAKVAGLGKIISGIIKKIKNAASRAVTNRKDKLTADDKALGPRKEPEITPAPFSFGTSKIKKEE